jgi:antitoxin component YwqK of YwqJK toxin-antitoxin module
MSQDSNPESLPEMPQSDLPQPAEITPAVGKYFRSQQDVTYAIVGGSAAALISAVIWALITVSTCYQIGYIALGVGLLVGFSVRFLGAGIDTHFGVIGAFFAVAGCALGNLLSQLVFYANTEGMEYIETLGLLNFDIVIAIYKETFTPIDALFYAIAGYEGFKFAFRPITDEEVIAVNEGKQSPPPYAKFRVPAAIVLFLTLSFCGYFVVKSSSVKKTYYYESGAKSYEGVIESGHPEGEWNYYYENGTLMSRGYFLDGKLDSVWSDYDEASHLTGERRYKQGVQHGITRDYFTNGKIQLTGSYHLGRREGEWTRSFENGKIEEKANYSLDQAEGTWERYYEDGTLRSKGAYRENDQVGTWTFWNEKGIKVLEADYGNGESTKIINSWDDNGKPEVVDGKGDYKLFYYNGQLAESGVILNGERTGLWKKYYPDGKPQEEGEYRSGIYYMNTSFSPEGKIQVEKGAGLFESFDNGTVVERGPIENGLRNGHWERYYPGDSTILEEINYANGKATGDQKSFFTDGTTQVEGVMAEDLRQGEWHWYHSSGILETTVSFVNDKKEGKQPFYDEDGVMLRWEEYHDGKLVDRQLGSY